MYMEEGGAEGKRFVEAPYVYVAILIALLAPLYLGILPAQRSTGAAWPSASLE